MIPATTWDRDAAALAADARARALGGVDHLADGPLADARLERVALEPEACRAAPGWRASHCTTSISDQVRGLVALAGRALDDRVARA